MPQLHWVPFRQAFVFQFLKFCRRESPEQGALLAGMDEPALVALIAVYAVVARLGVAEVEVVNGLPRAGFYFFFFFFIFFGGRRLLARRIR